MARTFRFLDRGDRSGASLGQAERRREDPATGSTLERRGGILVLHLYGTPAERGQAHGRLLRGQIRNSRIASYYGGFFADLYNSSNIARRIPGVLRRLVGELIEWWFYAPLERLFDGETREELYGMAEEAGLSSREVLRAVAAPDLMEHLAASFLRGGKTGLGTYYLGGCSAAYARNSALRSGAGGLFARNMDFPGGVVWRHPLVIFNHPTEEVEVLTAGEDGSFRRVRKTKQPYAYLSVAGFPGHGLTGVNASGVAMSTFVCISKNCSRRDPLTLDYNHTLFTHTDGIAAIRHMAETELSRSASPHTVVFADRREAIAVEVDSRAAAVRSMDRGFDSLVQTNHFLNPRLKKREMEFALERENTIGRFRLLRDAVEQTYGSLDPHRMVDLISCNADLESRTDRLLGDFPAQMITLTSAVFDLDRGFFWMAEGHPPAVCYNRYHGFDAARELAGQPARRVAGLQRSQRRIFPDIPARPVTAPMRASLRLCELSQEYLKKGKVRHAVRAMQGALSRHPEPGYRYILGLLYLIAGQSGRALEELLSLAAGHSFPRVKADHLELWITRSLDMLGRRAEARQRYRSLLARGGLVRDLERAARRGLRRPFSPADLPGVIDYSQLGPLEP